MSEQPFICRRCPVPQTLVDYNDLRAHLRAGHGIRELPPNDLNLYEIYPGSRYMLPQFRNRLPGINISNPSIGHNLPGTSTGRKIHSQSTVYIPMLSDTPNYQAVTPNASYQTPMASPSEASSDAIENIVHQQVNNAIAQEMESIREQNSTFQTTLRQENDEFRDGLIETIKEELKKSTKELFSLLIAQLPNNGDDSVSPATGKSIKVNPDKKVEDQQIEDQQVSENITFVPETSAEDHSPIVNVENVPAQVCNIIQNSSITEQNIHISRFTLFSQVPLEIVEEAASLSQPTGTKPKIKPIKKKTAANK